MVSRSLFSIDDQSFYYCVILHNYLRDKNKNNHAFKLTLHICSSTWFILQRDAKDRNAKNEKNMKQSMYYENDLQNTLFVINIVCKN